MFWVSGGQYTDSVHNRTSLEKGTQAYFSQEKWASPWSLGESGGQYTDSVHNRTRYVLGVRRSVHRLSTQPHKPCESHPGSGGQYTDSVHNRTRLCLGVDMDGSVHNRTNLAKVTLGPKVSTPVQYTTAQTLRKAPWFRRSVHRWAIKNGTHSESNTVHKLKGFLW